MNAPDDARSLIAEALTWLPATKDFEKKIGEEPYAASLVRRLADALGASENANSTLTGALRHKEQERRKLLREAGEYRRVGVSDNETLIAAARGNAEYVEMTDLQDERHTRDLIHFVRKLCDALAAVGKPEPRTTSEVTEEPQCPHCGQEMLPHEGGCPDDLCHGLCDDCCVHV